jgi:hypothetical protein
MREYDKDKRERKKRKEDEKEEYNEKEKIICGWHRQGVDIDNSYSIQSNFLCSLKDINATKYVTDYIYTIMIFESIIDIHF